jgi:hypothetical protein
MGRSGDCHFIVTDGSLIGWLIGVGRRIRRLRSPPEAEAFSSYVAAASPRAAVLLFRAIGGCATVASGCVSVVGWLRLCIHVEVTFRVENWPPSCASLCLGGGPLFTTARPCRCLSTSPRSRSCCRGSSRAETGAGSAEYQRIGDGRASRPRRWPLPGRRVRCPPGLGDPADCPPLCPEGAEPLDVLSERSRACR